MIRTALKRGKPLNHKSLKKLQEFNREVNDRLALCNRAGGLPYMHTKPVKISGKVYEQTVVTCYNGTCECGCGEFADVLEPHEKHSRGRGGKLSLGNTIMVKWEHHKVLQKSEPMWTKATASDVLPKPQDSKGQV